MGSSQSGLSGIEGFQIARVMPSSPAHVAGLIPFFDFILSVDNIQLSSENNRVFKEYINRNKNNVVVLSVFNTKIRMVREVSLTPSDTWGGIGLLGCSINWDIVEKAVENAWHIVEVTPNGAAAHAGLCPQRDYIVGLECLGGPDKGLITMFSFPGDFHARLEQWTAQRMYSPPRVGEEEGLIFLIYDGVENALREVKVATPRGAPLGIDVASGYLHAVPHNTGDMRLPFIKTFYVPSMPEQGVGGLTPNMKSQPPPGHHISSPVSVATAPPSETVEAAPAATAPSFPAAPSFASVPPPPSSAPSFPAAPPQSGHTFPAPPPQTAAPPTGLGATYQPPFSFPTLPPMPTPAPSSSAPVTPVSPTEDAVVTPTQK